ncbi:T cell leukemia homeobox 2 [Homo sapiens]|uniref:T cell leukemia homeobox 2 n=1 Tax=Homo sapiens TaxID=9606 RepID=F1T0F2_HUMAN|nr:T cell leukemia homeobox 2 [Homo sapiens]KAI4035140.1 T cell leukemia homeobox 2 [Homo sapiens]BAJ84026.1 T-cell leukemia homeobox protein 2 [Homo sapiens]
MEARCALALLWDAPHRPPLPKPDPSEAEEAAHVLLPLTGAGVGAALPAPEVPGLCGEGGAGQGLAHDRRTGQNVVPEPTHQVAAPDGGGARGRAAPRGPAAPASAAGRVATAAAAAAAPGPSLPAQLVALRAAEPAALGRGQQSGFSVRARLGGVSDARPIGVERRARSGGARGCLRPWSSGSRAREERQALRLSSRAPPPPAGSQASVAQMHGQLRGGLSRHFSLHCRYALAGT